MTEKLQEKQRRIYKPFTNCFPVMGKSARTFPMGGVHRISAGKAARAPTPGAPSASVGLTLRLAPGSPPRCGRARLPFALIIKGTKPSRELFFNQVKIPSLNKSTYGFCGHKCRTSSDNISATQNFQRTFHRRKACTLLLNEGLYSAAPAAAAAAGLLRQPAGSRGGGNAAQGRLPQTFR